MNEMTRPPLLAAFAGAAPPAPAWFEAAVAQKPERSLVHAAGSHIEMLSWGPRGAPGLLLLHGNGAHADWWSFIAPFFAPRYRVVAPSWSGMGGSAWRTHYTLDGFVEEAFEVAEAGGLFDAAVKPVVVGHSFGGLPAAAMAARRGGELSAVVLVDSPIMSPERRARRDAERRAKGGGAPRDPHPARVYPTLEAALNRFRLLPDQPCDNHFIADHIARGALRQVTDAGAEGWTWRFDPFMWRDFKRGNAPADLTGAQCPIAAVWGAKSALIDAETLAYMAQQLPPGSPMVEIAEAHHHIMIDQPLAFVTALRGLLAGWPR